MGYSLDRSSPKKGMPRSTFLDVKRKLTKRRYLCLWVLVALVPCYLLQQMFFYQSPSAAAYSRDPIDAVASGEKISPYEESTDKPYEKPTEVKIKEEKSMLDFIFKSTTIKPAQYTTVVSPLTKKMENVTQNSLKLKLKENFDEDDEDFGVAEDNDKAEEQMWTAPPAPAIPK